MSHTRQRTMNANFLCLLLACLLLSACQDEEIHYVTENGTTIERVAESEWQWSSLAITKEQRIFVAFPRCEDNVALSVGEITDQRIKPYPNPKINQFRTGDNVDNPSFISVQALWTGLNNRLWILDAANPQKKGIQSTGPVLYAIDLESNTIEKTFQFPASTYSNHSSFSNLIICESKNIAYIADSGDGAIVILDIHTGKYKKRLIKDPSTKAETNSLFVNASKWVQRIHVHCLSLDRTGDVLYYMPVSGYHLYKIPTAALLNNDIPEDELSRFVQRVALVGASQNILHWDDNTLLFSNIENNGIGKLEREEEFSFLVQHKEFSWISDLQRVDSTLYCITSQKHLPPGQRTHYKLFKISLPATSSPLESTH